MFGTELKSVTYITVFLFVFLLITNHLSLSSNPAKDYKEILETGERLLKEGEYERAVDEFLNAQPLIKDTKTLVVLHQLLSLAYFKMGNKERCEESLRAMFDLYPEKEINEEDYEDGYILIYHKVRAEYWYNLKSISDEEEKAEQKIIEKLAHKPKKKKSKLLRILTLSGIVVISGVLVAVLLGMTGNNESINSGLYGKLAVKNNSTFTVWYSISDIEDFYHSVSDIEDKLEPSKTTVYVLPVRTYNVTFFDDTHSQIQLVRVYAENLSVVSFLGWGESDAVKKNW